MTLAASASIRRRGVSLALAALSASPGAGTSAFQHGLNLRRAVLTPSPAICRSRRAASTSTSDDDPSLSSSGDDYERLRNSRPVRIRARLASSDKGGGGDMDASSSSATKIVHFQRHGQGTHNQLYKEWTEANGRPLDLSETDPSKNPLLLDHIVDAPLTQKGREQCAEQRVVAGTLEGVELVVCSPLVRALQTAHITFEDHLPHNSKRGAITWVAHEGIREELGTLMCNKRRALSATASEFPHVDFDTHLPFGDDDPMWDDHAKTTSDIDGVPRRESTEDMSHRAYDFLVNFVRSRPERELAVVGHSAWLLAMTGAVLDVAEEDRGEMWTMFGQAELRSMELVFSER